MILQYELQIKAIKRSHINVRQEETCYQSQVFTWNMPTEEIIEVGQVTVQQVDMVRNNFDNLNLCMYFIL